MSVIQLRTSPPLSIETTPAQELARDHIYSVDHTLLIAPKGAGKTRTALLSIQDRFDAGINSRVLVVCPNKVRSGWVKEGIKCGIPVKIIDGDGFNRAGIIASGAQHKICVIGADLLPWLKERYKTKPFPFDGLILDETTRYSSPGAAGVKALRVLRKKVNWVLGMTAQPVMEKPLAMYGQALVIDGGASLGTRFDYFRQSFFYQADYQGYDWRLMPDGAERLAAAVKNLIYIMDDADYENSLPPLVEEEVLVKMPPAAWRYYREIAQEMLIQINGEEVEATNRAVLAGKLEQLAQGAVYDSNEVAHWLHFAKMDTLDQLLAEADGPVIVCYQYRFEVEELMKRHPDAVLLSMPGALDMFNSGEVDLLLMHFRAGSHGINAQERCCEMICLKPVWSADGWDQIIGRIWRRGQTKPCRRQTIIVEGTVDDVILDRQGKKTGVAENLLGHLKKVAGVTVQR